MDTPPIRSWGTGRSRCQATGPARRARARARVALATALVPALASLASCTQDVARDPGLPTGVGDVAVGLVAAPDCDQLVHTTRDELLATVDQLEAQRDAMGATEDMAGSAERSIASADAAAPTTAAAAEGSGTAGSDTAQGSGTVVAGTNNQEAGVDEADLAKTDGRRLVTVVDGVLRVTVLDDAPAIDGRLDLPGGQAGTLFLRGDEAFVIGDAWSGTVDPLEDGATGTTVLEGDTNEGDMVVPGTVADGEDARASGGPISGTSLTRVDLSDPASPEVVESARVEGNVVASRMIDGTVRVVVRSTPVATQQLWWTDPSAARSTVAGLDAEDLLPRWSVDDGDAGPLGGCDDVLTVPAPSDGTGGTGRTGGTGTTLAGRAGASVAPQPADFERVTVLTVGDTLADLQPVTVAGGAETVYASTSRLFVTTTAWTAEGPATAVHRFDLTGTGPAAYTGSGVVPGALLDQYSLSERGDDLRLVTTTETVGPLTDLPAGGVSGPDVGAAEVRAMPSSEGRLAVLRPTGDGTLAEVGHVEDLGVGERVQSVRFLDDLAYVVTFRRTDPLYAVDLSDPTAPTVLGELKIPGFSEYLHPLGDGRLLGVGRDADPATGMDRGFKVSLFDVTEPTAPRELDTVVTADAWSPVSDDAHAFTWDPVRAQAVIPLEHAGGFDTPVSSCPPDVMCTVPQVEQPVGRPPGAVVIGVEGDSLVQRGEVTHVQEGGPWATILRSLVVDDTLWTVSSAGLGRTPAATPTTVDLLEY